MWWLSGFTTQLFIVQSKVTFHKNFSYAHIYYVIGSWSLAFVYLFLFQAHAHHQVIFWSADIYGMLTCYFWILCVVIVILQKNNNNCKFEWIGTDWLDRESIRPHALELNCLSVRQFFSFDHISRDNFVAPTFVC